ncbi:MAG: terminase B [Bacteroidales bacterium]|nr:terminase B [Bacteroidales bacterium]
MTDRRDFFSERIPVWRGDPVLFAAEVVGFRADDWQAEVLAGLAGHSRVAVKSGQGVGKTSLEAVALLWFLSCFPYSRVVATSPTRQQLHDVLWSEAAKWMSQSALLTSIFKWTKTYIYMSGCEKRWFAVARTATKPENMQGFHEENMLFIVDEASGVADPIMEAVLGTLSGGNNKLLLCGNPTRVSGTFYDAFTADRSLYFCRTVSSRDSERTNKANIDSLDRKYGRDSNVVRVRVDGEFPEQEDDVFIPISWIEESAHTEPSKETALMMGTYIDENGQRHKPCQGYAEIDIGVDVARYGDDKTCISYRVNEVVRIYKKYNGKDTVWTTGAISQLYRDLKRQYGSQGKIAVKIDDGGVGGGVTDQLKAVRKTTPDFADMEIIPVHFGQPVRHKRYYDTTTYMMSVVRDLIQPFDDEGTPRRPQLILPDDADVVGQLSCRKYGFQGTRVKVESKKDMKARGLSSPDEADSVLLAVLPALQKERNKRKGVRA